MNINTDNILVSTYSRVSTDKSDQANSLSSQIKYFSEYIKRRDNWKLSEIYYDEGITGTSIRKRSGFNRMIQDALSGKMKLIITKEVSRFARNTVDTLVYTRKLKARGVGVFFVNDNINTLDPDGELRLTIMASLAQEESRKTSERVKWGQKRRMEEGVVFGRDMLGYFVKNGKLILNPDEVDTVKLIFHKFAVECKGTCIIARELRESGMRPKRVRDWSNTTILRVLRNEKYVGDLCQKKTFTPDYLSHSKKYNRDQEDMVYLSNHHEAIIDRETWNKTQKELIRRSPNGEQKKKHSNRYWCSGKIVCGECGQRFVSRTKKQKSNFYKAWRCYAGSVHGRKKTDNIGNVVGCNSSSINEKVLLTCTENAIKYVQQNNKSLIKEMMDEIATVQTLTEPIDKTPILTKIDELNNKRRKAIDLVLDGTITREDLKRQTQFYDNEIEILTKQLAEIESDNVIQKTQSENLQRYISEIETIMEFNFENKLLYKELLDRIAVYNNKTVIVYLNCISFGLKFQYKTFGRNEKFSVNINKIELV